jgi:hypothetical protein
MVPGTSEHHTMKEYITITRGLIAETPSIVQQAFQCADKWRMVGNWVLQGTQMHPLFHYWSCYYLFHTLFDKLSY